MARGFCHDVHCPLFNKPQSDQDTGRCLHCGKPVHTGQLLMLMDRPQEEIDREERRRARLQRIEEQRQRVEGNRPVGIVHLPGETGHLNLQLLREHTQAPAQIRPSIRQRRLPPMAESIEWEVPLKKGLYKYELERLGLHQDLVNIAKRLESLKTSIWKDKTDDIFFSYVDSVDQINGQICRFVKAHRQLMETAAKQFKILIFDTLCQSASLGLSGEVSKLSTNLSTLYNQQHPDRKKIGDIEGVLYPTQGVLESLSDVDILQLKRGQQTLASVLLELAERLTTVCCQLPLQLLTVDLLSIHQGPMLSLFRPSTEMIGPRDLAEILCPMDESNLDLVRTLAKVRSVESFSYLTCARALVGTLTRPFVKTWCSDFQLLFDFYSRELLDVDELVSSTLGQAGFLVHARNMLDRPIRKAVALICGNFLGSHALLEQILDDVSWLRLRVLARHGRVTTLVQRALQSGDSNGVCFALTCFPNTELLFLLDPDQLGASHSILSFYASMGIAPARIRICVVFPNNSSVDHLPAEQRLGDLTRHPIELIVYPGGAGSLYQDIVNPNYISGDVAKTLFLHHRFSMGLKNYTEVGGSTRMLRDAVTDKQRGFAWLCRRVHKALLAQVKQQDRIKIYNFTDMFMEALNLHYQKKLRKYHGPQSLNLSGMRPRRRGASQAKVVPLPFRSDRPVILLFWVRGPVGDELNEVELRTDHDIDRYVPTVGKPWHHATRQLLITVRQVSKELAELLGVPVHVVPIGDKLKADFHHVKSGLDAGAKEGKPHNLIEYFTRIAEFRNRNRVNQLFFLYDLFERSDARIIQIGLRSGAIEQGMYLGMPTVYIDIETRAIQPIKPGEPDTTARMLNMTSEKGAFPMFHCLFSTNVIGVYPSHPDKLDKWLLQQAAFTAIRSKEDLNVPLDSRLFKGTLTLKEVRALYQKLVEICLGYEGYMSQLFSRDL